MLISGYSNLPSAQAVDIALLDQPLWVVGFPIGMSSVWVTVLADGRIQAFVLAGDVVESLPPEFQPHSVLGPPALGLIDDSIQLMVPPTPSGSPFTHPILLNSPDLTFASLNIEGNLVLWQHDRITHLIIDALTDSRLLSLAID